ncbi:MAG: cytidylate kinase-like family protein [Clostridiales bacterium]|nr:cytidylate kinase-like family protein [Clostridiales bacterium]
MDHFVITIARQYGSGGRTIGIRLAQELGIEYFDREIIRMASEDSGIHEKLFGRVDEYSTVRPPLFGKKNVYTGEVLPPQSRKFTSDENLFNYQAKIIRELAMTRDCVIIGRCSNIILEENPRVLRVFVCADWPFRREEASKKMSGSFEELDRFMTKDDKRKKEYYKRYTGVDWMDKSRYDLFLNNSLLGYDQCVEVIKNAFAAMKKKYE